MGPATCTMLWELLDGDMMESIQMETARVDIRTGCDLHNDSDATAQARTAWLVRQQAPQSCGRARGAVSVSINRRTHQYTSANQSVCKQQKIAAERRARHMSLRRRLGNHGPDYWTRSRLQRYKAGAALRAHCHFCYLGLQEQLADGEGADDGAGLAAGRRHAVQGGPELGVEHLQ